MLRQEYSGERGRNFSSRRIFFLLYSSSYFEPYGIPVSELDPKTIHVLNWTVTGCDDLIEQIFKYQNPPTC